MFKRERYLSALGLTTTKASASERHASALKRAYELRTFEIEHYWKRATYFWGFQVAIFGALGLMWREPTHATADISRSPLLVALAALGSVTALANWLTAIGSKFWQSNWEAHIDMLEDELEGPLHKTVWLPQGERGFSVSGVNETLNLAFCVFWGAVYIYTCWVVAGRQTIELGSFLSPLSDEGWLILTSTSALFLSVGLLLRRLTGLSGNELDEDGRVGAVLRPTGLLKRRLLPRSAFVRRHGSGRSSERGRVPAWLRRLRVARLQRQRRRVSAPDRT